MSEFDNITTPPPAPTGEVSSDDRTMALLAHLSGIILWFIGPLVFWLLHKDKPEKAFVTDQAKEALNFQITLTFAYVIGAILIGAILTVILIGALINLLIWLACVVFSIIAAVAANNGEAYRYPFAIRLIK